MGADQYILNIMSNSVILSSILGCSVGVLIGMYIKAKNMEEITRGKEKKNHSDEGSGGQVGNGQVGGQEVGKKSASSSSTVNTANTECTQKVHPLSTSGALYSPAFLKVASPLYDMHMGCENMGPMLYSLIRFLKPKRVLEIGAGYTSLFLLQALVDNGKEEERMRRMKEGEGCVCEGVEWR